MSGIIKLILLFLWMGVLPAAAGLLPVKLLPREKRTLSLAILSGFFLNFSILEVLGIPILLFTEHGNFILYRNIYCILLAAAALAGVLLSLREAGYGGRIRSSDKKGTREKHRESIGVSLRKQLSDKGKTVFRDPQRLLLLLLIGAVFLFQCYKAYTVAAYDGDDSYYVAESVQSWQTGTMYYYLPYTGYSMSLDARHALAMLPMWYAITASLTGTHPTIITHSMAPFFMLFMADTAMMLLAGELLRGTEKGLREKKKLVWLFLYELLQIFGGVSIYTPERFLMTRSWQGKSLFAVILLPVLFWILLKAAEMAESSAGSRDFRIRGREEWFLWLMAGMTIITGCLCTSLAPIYLIGLLLLGGLLLSFGFKTTRLGGGLLLTALPAFAYILLLAALLLPKLVDSIFY